MGGSLRQKQTRTQVDLLSEFKFILSSAWAAHSLRTQQVKLVCLPVSKSEATTDTATTAFVSFLLFLPLLSWDLNSKVSLPSF